MSFVGESDKQKEMVFGVHEEAIKDAFRAETFGLSPLHSDSIQIMDAGIFGVVREWVPKLGNVAPLVTYGVTVKQVPSSDFFGRLDEVREYAPVVAVYKQRKTDKDGKEYHVLSIGISGEVLQSDVTGYIELDSLNGMRRASNVICLQDTLSRAAMRHYANMTESTELIQRQDYPFQFLRDGKRKPGYEGAAHIAAVYTVTLDLTDEVFFPQDGYEMMGWFTLSDLMSLAHTQTVLTELAEDGDDIHFVGCTDPRVEGKLGHLWRIPLEPWSHKLAVDESGYFEHFIRNAVYHQQL